MNFKRKKTKRRVRCTLCTKYRWMGNNGKIKARNKEKRIDEDAELSLSS